MRRQLMLTILLVVTASDQVLAYDLSQHQWRHRLLFLIAPQADDPELATQQQDTAMRLSTAISAFSSFSLTMDPWKKLHVNLPIMERH